MRLLLQLKGLRQVLSLTTESRFHQRNSFKCASHAETHLDARVAPVRFSARFEAWPLDLHVLAHRDNCGSRSRSSNRDPEEKSRSRLRPRRKFRPFCRLYTPLAPKSKGWGALKGGPTSRVILVWSRRTTLRGLPRKRLRSTKTRGGEDEVGIFSPQMS